MRISDRTLATSFLINVNKTKEKIQDLQTQILTGSKINAPSDSPSGTSRILRIGEQVQSYEIYKKNIENGLSFVETTVSTMEAIQTEVEKLDVLFVDINNPTGGNDLTKVADQVYSALKSIIEQANTEYDGKYVLGGTEFSGQPYGFNAAGDAVEMKVANISGEQKIRISKNVTEKINTTGNEIFGNIDGTDIMNRLLNIYNDLKSGNKPSDADKAALKDFNKNLTSVISKSGDTINRFNSTNELIDNQLIGLKSLFSKENDVDVTQAVIDLQNQQYYLDVSYKMSSMILPKSLLDYM